MRDNTEAPPLLTFGQLRSFVALARWGKQAAATAALRKSQSQVSRDLAALERAVGGASLFNRTTRRPTAAGEALLDYALNVLEGWERLRASSHEDSRGAGQVVLTAESDVLSVALLPVLARLKQRVPELTVRTLVCSSHDAAETVRSGAASVAVFAANGRNAGLHERPLLGADILAAVPVSSPLAQKPRLSVAALQGQTLVLPPEGTTLRECAANIVRSRAKLRHVVCEAGPGRDAILAAVAAGLGVGLVLSFPQAGDPLLRDVPPGVVLRPLPALKPVQYCIAIRKALASGGRVGTLIRHLLRAFGA